MKVNARNILKQSLKQARNTKINNVLEIFFITSIQITVELQGPTETIIMSSRFNNGGP